MKQTSAGLVPIRKLSAEIFMTRQKGFIKVVERVMRVISELSCKCGRGSPNEIGLFVCIFSDHS